VIGKKRIGQEVLPIIAGIEDEIEKGHYIKKIAMILEVEESDVRNQLLKSQIPLRPGSGQANPKNDTKRTRREVVEEYVVFVALRLEKIDELAKVPFFKTDFWVRVIQSIRAGEWKSVSEIIVKLPAELRGRVEELMLREDEPDEKEWGKAVGELEEISIRSKIQDSRSKAQEVTDLSHRLADLTREK
jgi:hypothetical protein